MHATYIINRVFTSLLNNKIPYLLHDCDEVKQASNKWYERLKRLFIEEGYSHSSENYSLFTLQEGKYFITLLISLCRLYNFSW